MESVDATDVPVGGGAAPVPAAKLADALAGAAAAAATPPAPLTASAVLTVPSPVYPPVTIAVQVKDQTTGALLTTYTGTLTPS